jgi:hypothetical protein
MMARRSGRRVTLWAVLVQVGSAAAGEPSFRAQVWLQWQSGQGSSQMTYWLPAPQPLSAVAEELVNNHYCNRLLPGLRHMMLGPCSNAATP